MKVLRVRKNDNNPSINIPIECGEINKFFWKMAVIRRGSGKYSQIAYLFGRISA